LQPGSHAVAAWSAYGCSLDYIDIGSRVQGAGGDASTEVVTCHSLLTYYLLAPCTGGHTVAAWITYGYSLECMLLTTYYVLAPCHRWRSRCAPSPPRARWWASAAHAGASPYVLQAATICTPGCNRMQSSLQPDALRPATACTPVCNRMHFNLQPPTLACNRMHQPATVRATGASWRPPSRRSGCRARRRAPRCPRSRRRRRSGTRARS